jgi:hypothetical protein
MHPYSTDSNEREQIIFGLALLAVGAAWSFSRLLHAAQIIAPWWLDAPSTMGFFALFFGLFDHVLWRWSALHRVGLVKVPILTGNWRGHLTSSFDQPAKLHEVRVRINQTWTRVAILLQSDTSKSYSHVAAIQVEAPDGVVLSYQYENEPQSGAAETMAIHQGSARLNFEDGRCLEGYYYSGRGRQNYGTVHLERVQS